MSVIYLVLVISVSLLYTEVTPCLFKQSTGRKKSQQSYVQWEKYGSYSRPQQRNSTGHHCGWFVVLECTNGRFDNSFVFVVFRETESGEVRALGTAALVASNMLITSNKIFVPPDKTMLPYDAWPNAKGTRQAFISDLFLVPLRGATNFPKKFIRFAVKSVIVNPAFASSSQKPEKFPVDDVAIIIAEKNLINEGANVICLPESTTNFTVENLFYRVGIYDGAGGLVYDDPTPEIRPRIVSITLRPKDCFREVPGEFRIEENIICLRFSGVPPMLHGGPLLVIDKNNRTFLVGVASKVGYSQELAFFKYAYFTNLLPFLKYIEKFAVDYKSKWCNTPVMDLKFPRVMGAIPSKPRGWEADYKPEPRNESLPCVCGIKNAPGSVVRKRSAEGRIAGGEEAVPYEFPWMILILVNQVGGQSTCGGSLINDIMILTAAHCVVDDLTLEPFDVKQIQIYVRSHLYTDPKSYNIKAIDVIAHPEYVPAQLRGQTDFDIALLYLGSSIAQFFPVIKIGTVCLPKFGEKIDLTGKTVVNSGWGFTDITKFSVSSVLKKIELPVLPIEDCIKNTRAPITENVICAGFQNITQSSGSGDSGGPLILEDKKTKQWTQVGVVSFDGRNIDPDTGEFGKHPVFYADVQRLIRYIDYWANILGAKWCKSTPPPP